MKSQLPGAHPSKGFTLIELMIVVTIVGVLASFALPQFSEYVLQSRRSEARAAIEEIRNLQEEHFQNYKVYGDRTDINYPDKTAGEHYQVSVTPNGTGLRYDANATAIGNQSEDTVCAIFSITSTNRLIAMDSNNNLTTDDCW